MRYSVSGLPQLAAVVVCVATLASAHNAQAADTAKSAAPAKRPNVVVILCDDMGYSDIGAYGSAISTPNLDNLAEHGKKFTEFYNTARCCPARAALLTGLYPQEAGVGHLINKTPYIGYGDHLTSDCVTMAEVLHASGYATYMCGKWHVAPRSYDPKTDVKYWPTHRGFDKFYGTIAGSGNYYDPMTLCRGTTYITPDNDPEYHTDHFYYTDAITDNAIKYIDSHEKESKDKPFFMYIAYTAAHWPMQVPEDSIEPYRGKYDDGYAKPHAARLKRLKEMGLVPEVGDVAPPVGDWSKVKDKDKRIEAALMETYAGTVSRMDRGVGKVVDKLKKSGVLDNTLILYMQDNGACAEEWHTKTIDYKQDHFAPMKPDELQKRSAPPMQTRDGRPVQSGPGVMPGPADSYLDYKENWANVSNSPFRKYKHYVQEGGISTPLIAYWPDRIHPTSATQIVRTPGHLIDIMATLVDITKSKYPAERDGVKVQPMEGVSLAPALLDTGKIERGKPIFWEHEGNRAIRDGKWKLVAIGDTPWELYDMSVDRGEMNDLSKKRPELVSKLNDKWYKWAARARVLPLGGWKARKGEPDPISNLSSISLKQGDKLSRDKSLNIRNHGLNITARVEKGPVKGVILAQGASKDGYSLYARGKKIHFVARLGTTLHEIETDKPLPAVPFDIKVEYSQWGKVRLTVGDNSTTANFYGPLLLTPKYGMSAGTDASNSVGDYPREFGFRGKLGDLKVETNSKIKLSSVN